MTRISTERTDRVRKTVANFSAEKTIDKTDRLRKTAINFSLITVQYYLILDVSLENEIVLNCDNAYNYIYIFPKHPRNYIAASGSD